MSEKRLEIIKENVYMRSEIAKKSRLGIDTSLREELELLKEIDRLNNIINELENIRKEAIAFVKNNKDKTIAPYGDNEDTDYEVCLFEDDINDLLNILNKGCDKE